MSDFTGLDLLRLFQSLGAMSRILAIRKKAQMEMSREVFEINAGKFLGGPLIIKIEFDFRQSV